MIELDLGSRDDVRTNGIVGRRELACVQTIDIARLTAHPVALVPGAFIAVGGRGPKGDSNESGKTSFLAAVSLLLGDPEWRLGGGGAASVSALLFEPETAGTSAQRYAAAQHGYVIGVFADAERPAETALTVWCRLSAISPHVLVRWADGQHLAPGESDPDRHLNADDAWRWLGGKNEAGAASYASTLYGDTPRVLAYVAKRGSQRSDPSLLQMNAGAFSPRQIGADLIALTGRAGAFESEADQRERLDAAERRLGEVQRYDQVARGKESETLEKLTQRQDARQSLTEAERLWGLHFARGYLDVLQNENDLTRKEVLATEELAAAEDRLQEATSDLSAFDDKAGLEAKLTSANTTFTRIAGREQAARQAAADARALAASHRAQRTADEPKAAGWSGSPLEECQRDQVEAQQRRNEADQAVWSASEKADSTSSAVVAAERGGEGPSEVIATLVAAGIAAAALFDVVEVAEPNRTEWEPRLRLYADAVLIESGQEERALSALADTAEAVLVVGRDSDLPRPSGIAAAPQHAHIFLAILAERFELQVGSPATVADSSLGVVVLDRHEEAQTGRENRLARARKADESARAELAEKTKELDLAVVQQQFAEQDLTACEASARITDLDTKIAIADQEVSDHERTLDTLDSLRLKAQDAADSARLNVQAFEIAQDKAGAFVELRGSERNQAEAALRTIQAQKDALQVGYWEQGWGGTLEKAESALEAEVRAENTLRRRAGEALLEALYALGIHRGGDGAPSDELAGVARRRQQLMDDPNGQQQQPSFDAVVAPLREWLDSHAEMDSVMAERIQRTQTQRAAEIDLAERECSDLHDGLASLQDAVEQRVRQALDEIGTEFDKLTREAGGFGAELAIETFRPKTPQESWRWEVTPRWRRSAQGRMLSYNSQMNTAQEKLFTVHLVLAALLAAPNPHGRVLIIDELGDSLGINHRREVLRAIAATAQQKGVLVLGTCQDSVLADATTFCDEILYFECPSKTDALNRPTRMLGFDANGERVELLADDILSGRQLP
jgi:hypothetical protein